MIQGKKKQRPLPIKKKKKTIASKRKIKDN
jgi:hypothetical protein